VRQDDGRLLEGFPVVLVNAMKEYETLEWELAAWKPAGAFPGPVKNRWVSFMALSLMLCRLFGLPGALESRVHKLLKKCPEGEKSLRDLENSFSSNGPLRTSGLELSAERLKNSFRNYVVLRDGEKTSQQRDALEFE